MEVLRDRLDEIDEELIKLLIKRAEVALEVAEYKRQSDTPIRDDVREDIIIERLCAMSDGQLSNKAIERIYRKIFEVMRELMGSSESDS